jgi:cytochrome c-type biogenesis protein CcmE
VPNLFGPYALVIVEGVAGADGSIQASSLIIKHEDEFFSDRPPADSISSHFVDDPDTDTADESTNDD